MRLQRLAAAAAFLLLLTGCLPVTSTSPIGTTAGLDADPALFGTWRVVKTEDGKPPFPAYLHFLEDKKGTTSVLYVSATNKDGGWMAFDFRTVTLGTNRFLNAVNTTDSAGDSGLKGQNIPFLYTIKDRTLTLCWIDEDKIKAAITAREIAGTIAQGNYGDVTITAEPAALDAFFAKPEAAKLFKMMMVLRRVD